MSQTETLESIELKKELATISGKPQHIQIDAIKTKEAYVVDNYN